MLSFTQRVLRGVVLYTSPVHVYVHTMLCHLHVGVRSHGKVCV